MSLFKTRKEVTVSVFVYSKSQKEAFFEIMSGYVEKPVYVSHTKKHIEYTVTFLYYTNYKSFLYETSSLYPEYRFKFYRTK